MILSQPASFGHFDQFEQMIRTLNLRKQGRQYEGACPACGYPSGFSLTEKDHRILFYCHAGGCSPKHIMQALKDLGLWGSSPLKTFLPRPVQPTKSQPTPVVSSFNAAALWQASLPAAGSMVETYLHSRGIHLPVPDSIRFLPSAKHQPSGTRWPVMVSGVAPWQGSPIMAVHRTFLAQNGTGKAPVDSPKMSLGPLRGLSVHLAEPEKILLVTEGIETGLSVMQASGLPTWAALSAGGIQNLILPPLPLATEVIICADHDPVGLKAAFDAADLWCRDGRQVRIARPPQPGQDFNDLLKGAY